ncbi:MAG TPA: hypothetical protein VM734_18725 [Kofleriaceae bacterium]|nr:hypothetical protein [Kofleriaceae bacterium]
MLRSSILMTALAAASLAAACNPYDPDLGPHPFQCSSSEPKCPDGYECVDEVCTKGDPVDPGIDGSTAAFVCADDSHVEGQSRNDTKERAYVIGLAAGRPWTHGLSRLAICPADDKDHFKFTLNSPQVENNFEAAITSVAGRTPPVLKILNSQGVEISSGVPMGQGARVEITNRLGPGDYYVQVSSLDGTENNYDLSIKLCATPLPCP